MYQTAIKYRFVALSLTLALLLAGIRWRQLHGVVHLGTIHVQGSSPRAHHALEIQAVRQLAAALPQHPTALQFIIAWQRNDQPGTPLHRVTYYRNSGLKRRITTGAGASFLSTFSDVTDDKIAKLAKTSGTFGGLINFDCVKG